MITTTSASSKEKGKTEAIADNAADSRRIDMDGHYPFGHETGKKTDKVTMHRKKTMTSTIYLRSRE